MSFLYPRTIAVHRPGTEQGIGLQPYSGVGASPGTASLQEQTIVSGIPANIEARGLGRVKGLGLLPADAPGPGQWHITLPGGAVADGAIKDRDIVIDDLGYRYLVSQSLPTPLSYDLVAIRLET